VEEVEGTVRRAPIHPLTGNAANDKMRNGKRKKKEKRQKPGGKLSQNGRKKLVVKKGEESPKNLVWVAVERRGKGRAEAAKRPTLGVKSPITCWNRGGNQGKPKKQKKKKTKKKPFR